MTDGHAAALITENWGQSRWGWGQREENATERESVYVCVKRG